VEAQPQRDLTRKTVPWEATKLQGNHREIIRLHLQGLPNKQIADLMNMTTTAICMILKSPIVQMEIERLQEQKNQSAVDVRRELDELLPHALEAYRDVLDKERDTKVTPMQRVKVASMVFAQTGNGPITKNEPALPNRITAGELEALIEKAEKRKQIELEEQRTINVSIDPGEGNADASDS